jgi:PTH1 family peptidyl-tRNA hydrolase
VKLLVGLGNPEPRYRQTLHNVGFQVIDELARRHGARFESSPADAVVARLRTLGPGAMLVKPLTYVNRSGEAVAALWRYYRIEPADLLVVTDDVSLPAGRLRARARGSAGGHNGLKSIIEALGTGDFPRLRVGVGRGDPRRDLADHVLARPGAAEQETLAAAVTQAADAAELFVTDGLDVMMNRYNRPPDEAPAVADDN